MKRKSKLYARPMKPFEKSRIEEENVLLKDYALKNKKEVWKTLAKVNYYRKRAMTLTSVDEQQEIFFSKLRNLGLPVETTADVLGLKVEDLLKRRLPTIVAKKGIANTIKHARQLVVHKKILVRGSVVNSPSYIVPIAEEEEVKLKKVLKKSKPKDEVAPVEPVIQEEPIIESEQEEGK